MLHQAIFLATSNATMTNKKPFKLQRGCYTQATCLATLRKREGRSTFLATRNATIAVAKWGVTREFFLATCKLEEKLPRVTWPLRPCYTKQFFLQLATQQTLRCKLQEKNSRVTPHFATAIVALRVARKVERPSTFRNVARQVTCV